MPPQHLSSASATASNIWVRWHISSRLRRAALALAFGLVCQVQAQTPKSEFVKEVDLQQKLGAQLPLDLSFVDSDGAARPLGRYFGDRPVVLALGYYQCPNLCGLVLEGLTHSLAALTLDPGADYDFLYVSIDPLETPRLAASSLQAQARRFRNPEAAEVGWSFLTGDQANIEALAQAVGFQYRYDPEIRQYAHASGFVILTPSGTVSKYFYGIEFNPRDLRLALVEASGGAVGSPIDKLLLLCYHYNPITGKYGFVIDRAIKLASGATVLGLASLVGVFLWRERRQREKGGEV